MPPRSKVAQLPADMREWLHKALVDRAFGDIVALTEELNAKLKEGGVAIYVGKSAVGAESQKVKRAQETIKAATEAAKIISESSRDDGNTRGEAVMALIETEMFECILQIREAKAGETVSYGGTLRLARDSRLAVVSAGYADGYLRSLSGSGVA